MAVELVAIFTIDEVMEQHYGHWLDSPAWLYRLYTREPELLYVGITRNPFRRRLYTHKRTQPWWPQVSMVAVARCSSMREAARAEVAAIRSEDPIFNVRGRITTVGV